MISIQTLTIHEFRGLRHLVLDLKGKNFAVCGQNGTGKSGVVDALEFVLTGTVSRLTGQGRGDLSVKDHGPHVDSTPEQAYVEAVIIVPGIGEPITIRRTVKTAKTLAVAPDSAPARQVLEQVGEHPEIALSRREIIRYVLTEPGKRNKDVQALLKLDAIEDLRSKFQKISNAEQTASTNADRAKGQASENLVRALGTTGAKTSEIVAAANERRAILGLEPLQTLTAETSLKDGLATAGDGGGAQRVPKAIATTDIKALREALSVRTREDFVAAIKQARGALDALRADAALLDAVVRDNFLRTALELFEGEACPACDKPISAEDFSRVIAAKRDKLAEVARLRKDAEALLSPLRKTLESELGALRAAYPYAKALLTGDDVKALGDHGGSLNSTLSALADFMPLDTAIAALDGVDAAEVVGEAVQRLANLVADLPEPSAQDAARDFLTIAQERLEAFRITSVTSRTAAARALKAKRVFDLYADTSKVELEKVYEEVQDHFAALYRRINADDEGAFEAKLTPSTGKLGFNVDFYGRGFFPPGAYHSEGHQDSMGLCLYLALMKHLLGDGFTFSVLDDVLMSVDAGHRREVSRMLKAEFPHTQFVLTTHDKAWLKHMGTAKLVEPKNTIHFRKWTVDDGPSAWADGDIWAEIERFVQDDDVRAGAGLLRNYLEHLAGEYCQALRVRVEFSADGRHDLGDLLFPAIGHLRKLLNEALVAAESWKDEGRIATLKTRIEAFSKAAEEAMIDQWQVNPAIHYNEWANFHANDFMPLVAAFKRLTEQFTCATCGDLLAVTPSRGDKDYLQCECGGASFSFKKKPKEKASA